MSKRAALALIGSLVSGGCGGGGTEPPSLAAPAPLAGTCLSVNYAAPSGAANNISFNFDKPYACGQFANGDWWVSADSSGFVTITSISPAAVDGNNGFEINPASTTQQAFDSSASVTYTAAQMPSLPRSVRGVSSVVKSVSKAPGTPDLKFAAVLTVVDAPIANSSEVFRPGYFGATGKTFYSVPSAATIATLPLGTFTPIGVPSASAFSISSISARYRHVQLDHSVGFAGRDMHPVDNMPDYGAQIATDNAVYLLRMLLSDFNYSDTTHKQALINYLQMAIDLRAMAAGGVTWSADGGHGNGRKLPLQFAHMVFGGTDFSNAIAASAFSEDQQVYRTAVTGEVLWGRSGTEDGYWRTTRGALGELASGGAADLRDPYQRIDGGGYEVGSSALNAGYQFCCTSKPWKYTVLALYMLGLETPPTSLPLPATTPLVEYVERWVRYGYKAADAVTSISLTTGAITSTPQVPVLFPTVCARPAVPSGALYGTDYGPNGNGSCIAGTNNWVARDNTSADSGFYNSTFGDELWAWYR